ncbi:hypothetical protein V3851_15325 [Paenibacillus sp. M1]|uniref:Methyltransferase domain-containing protein n=1 Tax=Paenibacillus haidiansis TaxID=1574488 RepID=A0ABU7VTY1_9BACL
MKRDQAASRAVLTDSRVIDARSLQSAHKRLAEILTPGMSVLDAGCGNGAITCGIPADVYTICGRRKRILIKHR